MNNLEVVAHIEIDISVKVNIFPHIRMYKQK